ncbi:uncharacterized protein Z520_05031 [Fonsecaea multimorphosa CBS 102226]|uniref:Uncharacterized protein n=1 Tax=Fonsecaea multimorphosa CBS 102226 TaxID=1442371 RepID=A0A0D2HC58_9EURO|nr:uncharacterized protein Z520_05031 [Fonsecaea multimorphosa CBS 102226]KIX99455.1 hypothetical protein Z520_05031 [Fonsecaea multimorphosa CBS 102226]OAL25780.1 hypothetical protein AYO22_04769 [Fonsecaea multimorphosa]
MPEPNNNGLHSLKTNAEVAAMAASGVYAANELGKAISDDYKDASDHYMKAAVGAAVAVGAFQLLQKQKRKREEDEYDSSEDEEHHHRRHEPRPRRYSDHEHRHEYSESPGHTRRLLEEAVGAYSLGKELLGDRRHHVIHLVTEALGAVAAIKEVNQRSKEAREV